MGAGPHETPKGSRDSPLAWDVVFRLDCTTRHSHALVNQRDKLSTPAVPAFDPAQLSFGDVDEVPQLRVGDQGALEAGETEPATYREPPVCGESSYDDVEHTGPSWSVRIVQEVELAPPAPRVMAPSRRPATSPAPVAKPPSPSAAPKPTTSAALDSLRLITELSPDDAQAAISYAQALDKHGESAAALAVLGQCLTAGGDAVPLLCARAFLLGTQLKYDLADADLQRAVQLRGEDAEVQVQIGILACRRARWRDAVAPLERGAEQRPDDAAAHFYLGEALNHSDLLQRALRAYERATTLDPSNWRAYKGVGIALDRLGRPEDAAAAYRQMRDAKARSS